MTTRTKIDDNETPTKKAANTAKWAVTMTKVRIRRATAKTPFPRWNLITFYGPEGVDARGVVDMIAVRKDHHSTPQDGLKRGDAFQMILIQVKGGSAARPTQEDAARLQLVAGLYHADHVLLAAWTKGDAAQFFSLDPQSATGESNWSDELDESSLKTMFCNPIKKSPTGTKMTSPKNEVTKTSLAAGPEKKGSQATDESLNDENEPLDGITDVEGTRSQIFVGGVRKPRA